jgi:hypothetical protein
VSHGDVVSLHGWERSSATSLEDHGDATQLQHLVVGPIDAVDLRTAASK